ncbi:MAG: FAD:protein FMN transferase [Parasporobacterium sp.]|nr:FAD:protein FMN transferase [Parasporobacterium sp.]
MLICLLVCTGCSLGKETSERESASRELFAMDTIMTLTVYGEHAQEVLDLAEAEIERLDQMLSTGNPEGEIGTLNRTGKVNLSDDAAYLFEESLKLNDMSENAFNPMIYPVMEAWGFTTDEYRVPSKEEIGQILPLVDLSLAEYQEETGVLQFRKEGVKIDFGGIAKGYTSGRLMELFQENGIEDAVVSLGGNVQVIGKNPKQELWKVAIRDPQDPSGFLGIVRVTDQAVITSGGYERYFEEDGKRYHHIIDPNDGFPADQGLISVTVISRDGTLADGLSTALYVMGLNRAEELWKQHPDLFDAVFVTDSNELYITEGLKECFTSDTYTVKIIPE